MAASSNRFVPLRWMIAGVTASLVASAGGLSGCSSRATGEASAEREGVTSTRITRLRDAAARERSQDPARTASMALPPGIAPEQIAPLTGDDLVKASIPLTEAVDQVLANARPAAAEETPAVSEADQDEGLRLYLQARNKLSSDDPAAAQEDLIASLKRDPRPAEVWRELGEAQRRLGNRSGALLAYQQAAFREPDDERTLEQIGRLAFERREYSLAAEHLGRLSRRPLAQIDPVLPYTVNAQLGRSLIALGYVGAGIDALRTSLDLPDRLTQVTTRAEDFSALFRQRGELWRDIGDGYVRLGRFDDASRAYAESAAFPTLNPGSIVSRRVYTLLREGRSAGAAGVLIEEVIGVRGRCDARTLDLIGYLAASDPQAGRQLGEAIEGVPELLSENERTLAAGSLARARAAAVGPEAGVKVLRDYLARTPGDDAVLSDLLTAWRSRPPAEALEEVIELVDSAPLFEPKYVAALVRSSGSTTVWLEEVDRFIGEGSSGASARLVKARLLMMSARVQESSDILAQVLQSDPRNTAAIVAQVRALTALGQSDAADALLNQLPDSTDPAARFAKAVALADRDNSEAALALVTPMLEQPADATPAPGTPPRADVAMLAARLALRLDRAEDAEKWYQAAIAADPMRDEAYAGLMRLYSPNQPLASEQKLMETAQTLRAAVPSSPTLRWLHARENAARGQFDVAERELVELDDQYPDQTEILELLTSIWSRTGSLDRAATYLRQRVDALPASREYPVRLADVLAARGKSEEARKVLEALIERSPGDLFAMRRLETLLRDKLGDPKGADEVAIRRLDRSPRTFDTSLERTLVLLRHGDADAAAAAADDAVHLLGPTPAPDRLARIAATVAKITQESDESQRVTDAAVDVQSRLMEAPGLSTQAHTAHIVLLARRGGDLAGLLQACDRAVDTNPSMRESAYLLAIREISRTDRPFVPDSPGGLSPSLASLRIAEHAALRPGQLTATLAAVWMDAAAGADDTEALDRAIAAAQKADLFETALDAFSNTGRASGEQRELARADPLAAFAEAFLNAGKEERADEMYRLALKFNPEHAQSNNAVGYRLLEKGESLDEAERMIELAYRQAPSNSAIIDSLGWVRYKRGIIHNEVDAEGRVTRRGAISLLSEAVREANNSQLAIAVPILCDHLADAVWASGNRQRAVELWEQAATQAAELIANATQQVGQDRVREMIATKGSPLAELRATETAAQAKVRAAKEDREPAISKIFAPVNQPATNDTEQINIPGLHDPGDAGAPPPANQPVVLPQGGNPDIPPDAQKP